MNVSKWIDAKGKYTEVLSLDANNSIAKQKLEEIELKLQEESDLVAKEKKFNELVQKGNADFAAKKYALCRGCLQR